MQTYEYITTKAALESYAPEIKRAKVMGIDTETTGMYGEQVRLRLIQIAVAGLPTLVLDCDMLLPACAGICSDIFTGKQVKVFQNAKFDLAFFYRYNIRCGLPIFDTMLAAGILRTSLDFKRVGLDALAEFFLAETLPKELQKSNWSGTLTPEQLEYAAKDAEILLRLREAMIPYIQQFELAKVAEAEFACMPAVVQMEHYGILLDMKKWKALTLTKEQLRNESLAKVRKYMPAPIVQPTLFGEDIVHGVNLDSPAQVKKLLQQNGIFLESTSRQALGAHRGHPLVDALTSYRTAEKLLTSFLYPIPTLVNKRTGRLHPVYMQIGAYSGRMSCGRPNIQQIPRERAFRECFVAPEGKRFIIADYSQIELRVMAQITEDKRMLAAYRNGEDLHALTASLVLEKSMEDISPTERQAAKAINFGLIYGMSPGGLKVYARDTYGVELTDAQTELFCKRFFDAYTGVAAFHDRLRKNPPKEIRTLLGRRVPVKENTPLSTLANTPVQGTAADIFKRAMAIVYSKLMPEEAYMIAVVHDEIILEVIEDKAEKYKDILEQTMVHAASDILDKVPVIAEAVIAKNWAAK